MKIRDAIGILFSASLTAVNLAASPTVTHLLFGGIFAFLTGGNVVIAAVEWQEGRA